MCRLKFSGTCPQYLFPAFQVNSPQPSLLTLSLPFPNPPHSLPLTSSPHPTPAQSLRPVTRPMFAWEVCECGTGTCLLPSFRKSFWGCSGKFGRGGRITGLHLTHLSHLPDLWEFIGASTALFLVKLFVVWVAPIAWVALSCIDDVAAIQGDCCDTVALKRVKSLLQNRGGVKSGAGVPESLSTYIFPIQWWISVC